jgi:hypothetical protein
VTLKHTGKNQHGDVVALATRSCLMWTREAHAAQREAGQQEAVQQEGQEEEAGQQGTA